jgi:protein-tyrosine phosphatase/membrane-associated phospholipid phosphatase
MPAEAARAPVERRPWRRAALWLVLLGPFFFATYGFANWMASQRAEVGAIVFQWEHRIPFLAWTIVPYWSIDVLYAVSVFVCASRGELDVHVRRLLAAQVVAVACFLLFPLQFVFERPPTDGVYGWMFDVLTGFDKPFNQAPSLHIALLVIIWFLFSRHARGPWRWAMHGWFVLIGASVLTTYQHHFIDVPTGLWVGWLCVWLFPVGSPSLLLVARATADPRRRVLALRYGLAAAALGVLAVFAGGWALWLLWPAGSLALVSAIYGCFGETAFQKRADGTMGAAAWWLLAPYMAGAWLNSRWWTRSVPAAHSVVPGVMLGRLPTRVDREPHGARAIVDTTAELPCAADGVRYTCVPQLDLVPPSLQQVERCVDAIETAAAHQPVLVCCALGYSRSATAIAAWLLASGRAASPADAVEQVRRARPAVVLSSDHLAVLEQFAGRRRR